MKMKVTKDTLIILTCIVSCIVAAQGCGSLVEVPAEIVHPGSADEYNNDESCVWTIVNPNNGQIFLLFEFMSIEYCGVCSCDRIDVFDGGVLIRTLCGYQPLAEIVSTSSNISLVFSSDGSVTRPGFRARVSSERLSEPPDCGDVLTELPAEIMFPHTDTEYQVNEFCEWTITNPNGGPIYLIFEMISVEDCAVCQCDAITVYDGPTLLYILCNTKLTQEIVSTTSTMRIMFSSDASVTGMGFHATLSDETTFSNINAHLYWTYIEPNIDQSNLAYIVGDPKSWVPILAQEESVDVYRRYWNTSNYIAGPVASDYYMRPHQFVSFDRQGGSMVLFLTNPAGIDVHHFHEAATLQLVDLCLDWVSRVIYYTDHNRIVVFSYTNFRYQVLMEGLNDPGSIDVDPQLGQLFWVARGANSIVALPTTGGPQRTIRRTDTSDVVLTVDTQEHYIIWSSGDANSLHIMDYNGENERTLLPSSVSAIAALDVYAEYLFVAHADDKSIDVYDQTTGDYITHFLVGDSVGTNIGISVASPLTQPLVDSPCSTDNGGCQHICIHGDPAHICRCQFGYTLGGDGVSCSTYKVLEEFLVISDVTAKVLYQVDLSSQDIHEIPIHVENGTFPEAVTYDADHHTVYWTVRGLTPQTIRRRNLDTDTDELFLTLVPATTNQGICIDVIRRRLYYSDAILHKISDVSLDDPSDYQDLMQLAADELPFDLQLDVDNGHIYWTNRGSQSDDGGKDGSIDRADLSDGANHVKLFTGLQNPTALALDIPASDMYWCDYAQSTIEKASMDGTNREVFQENVATLGLAVDADYVYTNNDGVVFRITKETRTMSRIPHQLFSAPFGIYAYSPSYMPATAATEPATATPEPSTATATATGTIVTAADQTESEPFKVTTIIIIAVCVGGVILIAIIIAVSVIVSIKRRSRVPRTNDPLPPPPGCVPNMAFAPDLHNIQPTAPKQEEEVYHVIPANEEDYLTASAVPTNPRPLPEVRYVPFPGHDNRHPSARVSGENRPESVFPPNSSGYGLSVH